MPRTPEFVSKDFSGVEPLLVSSSGGSDPQAAVAWEELESTADGLRLQIATKVSPAEVAMSIEQAVASLFYDVPLIGGITEQRQGIDNRDYFFTRFEVDLVALTGNPAWATRRFNDDALLDANGNQIDFSYGFRIVGDGRFNIEFQSATRNPVIANNEFTLVVQRRPNPAAGTDIPAWLAPDVTRIGEPLFRQIFTGMGVDDGGVATVRFTNGNTFTEEAWTASPPSTRDYYMGVQATANGYQPIA